MLLGKSLYLLPEEIQNHGHYHGAPHLSQQTKEPAA